MKTCYVVMRNSPNFNDEHNVESCVKALTDNLYLAEKVIANYYTQAFGEDGGSLVCTLQPGWTDHRTYWMRSHYKEIKGATYFTVYEEEIKDDSALL